MTHGGFVFFTGAPSSTACIRPIFMLPPVIHSDLTSLPGFPLKLDVHVLYLMQTYNVNRDVCLTCCNF